MTNFWSERDSSLVPPVTSPSLYEWATRAGPFKIQLLDKHLCVNVVPRMYSACDSDESQMEISLINVYSIHQVAILVIWMRLQSVARTESVNLQHKIITPEVLNVQLKWVAHSTLWLLGHDNAHCWFSSALPWLFFRLQYHYSHKYEVHV